LDCSSVIHRHWTHAQPIHLFQSSSNGIDRILLSDDTPTCMHHPAAGRTGTATTRRQDDTDRKQLRWLGAAVAVAPVALAIRLDDRSLKQAKPPANAHASCCGFCLWFGCTTRGFREDACMHEAEDFAWTMSGCLVTMYVNASWWVWVPTSSIDDAWRVSEYSHHPSL
jgi:hypothetical protein